MVSCAEGGKGDLGGKAEEESSPKTTSQDSAQFQKLYEYAKQHMQQVRCQWCWDGGD